MTQLVYNNITLAAITTPQFSQEAVYDASHSDYLYTKYTIGVKAVFNPAFAPSAGGSETPAQTMLRVKNCLMTQCQQLVFSMGNGTQLIKNPADGVPEDVKHGPFPLKCNIIEITEATFLVDYAVETYMTECCAGTTPPYISNRWSETDDIDENMYTKRTVKGRIIFRADQINSKKFNNGPSADSYRGLVPPPALALQPNFARISMNFMVPEDGLSLDYTIIDQELYCQPPEGATKFTGEHTVTTSKGAVYSDVITATLYGNATTSKSLLLARAAQLIVGRLDLSGNKVIKAGYVKDKLEQNVVEIRVETFGGVRPNTFLGLNLAQPNTLSKLNYILGDRRSNQQPDPGTRGTANLAMITFNNYLSLCNVEQDSVLTTFPVDFPSSEAINTSVSTSVVSSLPQQPTMFDTQQTQTGVYTTYLLEIDYRINENKLQLAKMDTSRTDCAVFSVAQPTMTKVVGYRAERWGKQPSLPAALTTDPNAVFLKGHTKPMNVDVAPDGSTLVYNVSGEYHYAVIDPTKEEILGGLAPYLNTTFDQTKTGNYVNGLADPVGSPLQERELRGNPDAPF